MHTFFINTSKKVDTLRHELLFDNLVSRNKIKVLNYELGELNVCAEKISEIITRFDNVAEIYNIIVYVEISGRNEFALAAEEVASLQIEETLFSRLYDLGRKPNQALILFGENFDRDAEYGIGNTYIQNVRKDIWKMFPLPEVERAKEIIKKISKGFGKITEKNLEGYQNKVCAALTCEYATGALLPPDSEFVIATLREMVESIMEDDLESVDLLNELYISMTNQKEHVKLQVTTDKVKYAHIRLEDSDFNVKNKTEYRILLYVYYCALTEKIAFFDDEQFFGDNAEQGGTLGYQTIPQINWQRLSTDLKEKRDIFIHELEQIELFDEEFPRFNESLLVENNIISLSAEMPQLFTDVKVNGGLTVAQLQATVNKTLDTVETQNRENEKRVISFVTRVTDAFSIAKDSKMTNVTYKRADEFIENIQLTDDFIKKEIDVADGRIAAHKRLSMATTHIDELIKETKIRVEYCFDCLQKSNLIYIVGVLFTLMFAVPYAVIQKTIFDVFRGWLFYFVTVAVVIAAFTVGYIIFKQIFKFRIIRELNNMCGKFALSQKEKQKCLEEYALLIRSDIPLSFCLKLYRNEFDAFVERKKAIPEFITYHTKVLNLYINYINNILCELDIAYVGEDPEPKTEYTSIVTIELDKYQNNTLYSLIFESFVSDYYITNQKGGNK